MILIYFLHYVLLRQVPGMRRSEILSLTWEQVDFAPGVINIMQSKSGRSRAIPMNDYVVEELETIKARGSSEERSQIGHKTRRADRMTCLNSFILLMDVRRIELLASALRTRRSPS